MTALSQASHKSNRQVYIEFLRILASYFVIFLHTGNYGLWNYTLHMISIPFLAELCFSVFSRIAVPLFFMISGSFLLDKDESIATVLKKRVGKYIKIIVAFSLINYIIDNCMIQKNAFSITEFGINVITGNVPGAYWYLYVTLGLMILLPFLRSIARQMTYGHFKLLVAIILSITFVFKVVNLFWLSEMSLSLNSSFTGAFPSIDLLYFLVGYGMVKYVDLEKRPKRDILITAILGVGSILIMAFLTIAYSISNSAWASWTFEAFSQSLAVITAGSLLSLTRYFMRNVESDSIFGKIVVAWGGASVGVVIFEGLVRKLIFVDLVEYIALYVPVFVSALITSLIVCVICSLIAAIIQRTPILKELL